MVQKVANLHQSKPTRSVKNALWNWAFPLTCCFITFFYHWHRLCNRLTWTFETTQI